MNDESYDFEDAAEAADEIAEYFEEINSYDRDQATMDDKQGLVKEAVGAIGAFSSSAEYLDERTDDMIEGDYDESEIRDAVMQTGVAMPDAMKAYNTIEQAAEEVGDRMVAAAFMGDEEIEAAGEKVDELRDLQHQYHEAIATVQATSSTLAPEGYDTPVDVAQGVAEDEEVLQELSELEEDIPRTPEERDAQLQDMIEAL